MAMFRFDLKTMLIAVGIIAAHLALLRIAPSFFFQLVPVETLAISAVYIAGPDRKWGRGIVYGTGISVVVCFVVFGSVSYIYAEYTRPPPGDIWAWRGAVAFLIPGAIGAVLAMFLGLGALIGYLIISPFYREPFYRE